MHLLIIGGTGMLAEASILLASRYETLTLVARSRASLLRIDRNLDSEKCDRHLLNLDWSQRSTFIESISQHIQSVGIPNRVLAWVHEDRLAAELARMFASHTICTDFFHVRGSAAANPAKDSNAVRDSVMSFSDLNYHEIILGFQLTDSSSKWLSHSEISKGVTFAIDHPKPKHIVGTVEPWSARP